MAFKIDNYLMWIVSIIFTAGIIYANVIKIPAIERSQQILEIKQSVIEANYTNIKESLNRIEKKLERR